MIWWAIAFAVAIVVDTFIRSWVWTKTYTQYTKFMMEALQSETEKVQKGMLERWGEVIELSTKRFGIVGELIRGDTIMGKDYRYTGRELSLSSGVVMTKRRISSEEIVNNLATLRQADPKLNFKGTADDISTKYYVEVFIQELNKRVFYNDKGLFNNVESGDSVALSLIGNNILGIGYTLKNKQD